MSRTSFAAIALATLLTAAPAWAQNQGNGPSNPGNSAPGAPASSPPGTSASNGSNDGSTRPPGTATINPTGIPPSQRNPLLTDNGEVQIGKLIGTDIYNKDDKQIGTVREVLANHDGQVQVVVGTNNKRVLVPWNELEFGDAKLNSHNKVLMLNATQASLDHMPAYNPNGRNGKNG